MCTRLLRAMLCASAAFAANAQEPSPAERAATEGFVIARVATNGAPQYALLTVEGIGEDGRDRRLPRTQPLGKNPTTYGGWLPAGEYRFKSLQTPGISGYTVGYWFDFDEMLPTFVVEAGRLTDLGTLIQQPVGTDRATIVQWPNDKGFDRADVDRWPGVAAALTGDPAQWDGTAEWKYRDALLSNDSSFGLIGIAVDRLIARANRQPLQLRWQEAETAQDIVQMGQQMTVATTLPEAAADGGDYFGSPLGQILRRTSGGAWETLDTGLIDEIGAVLVDGTTIYAGTADGRLLVRGGDDAPWVVAPKRFDGAISSIGRLPDATFVVATTGSREIEPRAYRGTEFLDLPTAPWKVFGGTKKIELEPRRRVTLSYLGGRLLAWVDPVQLFVYDVDANKWSESPTTASASGRSVNLELGLAYSGGFRRGSISRDAGRTWQQFRFDGTTLGMGFTDADNGVAIVAPNRPAVTENFVTTTTNGGQTWVRTGNTPAPCARAFHLVRDDVLLCMLSNGTILSSTSGGEWTAERAVL